MDYSNFVAELRNAGVTELKDRLKGLAQEREIVGSKHQIVFNMLTDAAGIIEASQAEREANAALASEGV